MPARADLMAELPASESTRLIDFGRAKIVTLESDPPQYLLVVSGTKPYFNMIVELSPLTYIRQPEFWGIEVVGRLPSGIGLPALAPYEISLPLAGIMGTEGVEVIGAMRSERLELDGERAPNGDDAVEPVVLDLRGDGAELRYRSGGAPSDLELTFRDDTYDASFKGSEVRLGHGELGRVVTVSLSDNPDAPVVSLTLLLPAVRFEEATEQPVETLALVTEDREHAFTTQRPIGQVVTYRALSLSGTAGR
jgi:hypothetical protein